MEEALDETEKQSSLKQSGCFAWPPHVGWQKADDTYRLAVQNAFNAMQQETEKIIQNKPQIIYLIATHYIFRFNEKLMDEKNNFRQADVAEYAKDGTLERLVQENFGK